MKYPEFCWSFCWDQRRRKSHQNSLNSLKSTRGLVNRIPKPVSTCFHILIDFIPLPSMDCNAIWKIWGYKSQAKKYSTFLVIYQRLVTNHRLVKHHQPTAGDVPPPLHDNWKSEQYAATVMTSCVICTFSVLMILWKIQISQLPGWGRSCSSSCSLWWCPASVKIWALWRIWKVTFGSTWASNRESSSTRSSRIWTILKSENGLGTLKFIKRAS